MRCRHCATPLARVFVDLGAAPPSNAFLNEEALAMPETRLPLKVYVCDACRLVQTRDVATASAYFTPTYVYFSGISRSWVAHCDTYAAAMIDRFRLGPTSRVVEIASNDGTLLAAFAARGVPVLGVEPTASTAAAARARGIETLELFFSRTVGAELAAERGGADLIAANNVLAHVPDIGDFVRGFAALLAPTGVVTFEFPSLVRLVEACAFDTIYHEHFSYLSLFSAEAVLSANGLVVFDVERLSIHGGSLRVYAHRADGLARDATERLAAERRAEAAAGIDTDGFYEGFQTRVDALVADFVAHLREAARAGRRVAGYGAAAKGNTLLNYAGVREDLIAYVVDGAPSKQGLRLPGSRIPVSAPERLLREPPDEIVVFPWNIFDEIEGAIRELGLSRARIVTAVPRLVVREPSAA